MNYPNNIEQKLGFNQIIELVKTKCLSESGKEKLEHLTFMTDYRQIETELSIVDEMREILILDYQFPLSHFDNLTHIFEQLEIEDAQITLSEIVSLKKFVDIFRSILRFFEEDKHQKFKELIRLSGQTTFHKYVNDQINSVVNKKGEIKDNASSDLQNIRSSLRRKQNEVSQQINKIYAKIKQSSWLDADLSVTIVNGRLVVPIDSAHKRKITGMVHDVSATGKTSYIEPTEVLNLNNEIVELEYQEKKEIEKILFQLCKNLRPYTKDLIQAFDFLSLIDMYRAKAKYAIQIQAIKPAVYPNAKIFLSNAKHPILYLTLEKENKELVPLNIQLGQNDRIVLISGPNAGGKSVALKTVGLIQLMMQKGFLLPVGGASEMGVFDNIFIDIGDEQSLDNDLSTYSSHLMNMKYFLKNSNAQTLILIDEFGTGTEPALGGAIAESVLEELNQTQTFGVVTTHYSNLKHFAASQKGLLNAAMMFDNQRMLPLFQIELGQAGSSFAFEIARKIGIPENILTQASKKVGKEQVDFDKHLREVLRDKKYWNEKRYKIRQEEKQIDKLIAELSSDTDEIKSTKKKILSGAKKEAQEILETVNKRVEKTIRDIRESQAEKEKTKEIRQEFEDFKKEIIAEKQKEEEAKILKKITQIKEKRERKIRTKTKSKSIPKTKSIKVALSTSIKLGAKVRIKDSNTFGEVISLDKNKVVLAVGDMQMSVSAQKLELISQKDFKRNVPQRKQGATILFTDSMTKKIHFKAHLDIRGQRVNEAIHLLTKFIDDAITTNTRELKILHGTGTGALKIAVREYLQTIDLVASVKDELLEMGGAGITVVTMQ